mmetsp:Transcript_11532/g.35624  ORF Transcript_11532/g.35624 Transcript_11532/m.35624 type:complete len:88 (+) Transcript_11532:1602-1865(+)
MLATSPSIAHRVEGVALPTMEQSSMATMIVKCCSSVELQLCLGCWLLPAVAESELPSTRAQAGAECMHVGDGQLLQTCICLRICIWS